MPTLKEASSTDSKAFQGYQAYNSSALVAGTTASKLKIATSTNYTSGGQWKNKGVTDEIVITAGLSVQPEGTTCYYAISLQGDGTVVVTQGAFSVPPAPNNFIGIPATLPVEPVGTTLIGYMKVVTSGTSASAGFTPGTTSTAATGVTTTFWNGPVGPDAESF